MSPIELSWTAKKTIRLFGGFAELVRNALFSQGGTLTNGAKVASERRNVKKTFFSNSYILGAK